MAVLCGGISVVMRAERILSAFPNLPVFVAFVSNDTLTTDSELFRLGFLTSLEATDFVASLEAYALRRSASDQAGDLVVTDQDYGPTTPCDWIEFGRFYLEGAGSVAAARLVGGTSPFLAGPRGSRFSSIPTQSSGRTATSLQDNFFKLVHADRQIQVYSDPVSGKEIVVKSPHRLAVAF
jgi:hypothetical protein